MTPRIFRSLVALACLAVLLAACGDGDGGAAGDAPTTTARDGGDDGELVVHPASYDLAAGEEERFIAGASFPDGSLLAYGSVEFEFLYLGTREEPLETPRPGPTATAVFFPIPGEGGGEDLAETDEPVALEPSEARGVYGAHVRFDDAGFWRVVLTAEVDGEELRADGAFGVSGQHQTPAPGDPAPETDHPTAGTEGVDPAVIDSRARDGDIPDVELHQTTVSDALAAGKPVLVVVSTPVYCVSRFCGPITDAIAELAATYEDRAAFVHIEVWEDFEAKKVNAAAQAWMTNDPSNQNLTEPWVFLVGADGVITHRWGNVATVAEMTAALEAL